MIIGILIFPMILPYMVVRLQADSLYQREPMEKYLLDEVFGKTMITEALTELCIVSYSLSRQEARLYSKFMVEQDPDIYNMRIFDAAAATSAAPLYWNLKDTKLPGGKNASGQSDTEVLLDGGIIQNNPSIYATALYNAAVQKCIVDAKKGKACSTIKNFSPDRPIRLISIGTGGSPRINAYKSERKGVWPMIDWFKLTSHISMNTASTFSTIASAEVSTNFLRMDVKSYIPMDDAT